MSIQRQIPNEASVKAETLSDDSIVYNVVLEGTDIVIGAINYDWAVRIAEDINLGSAWVQS